ncbi:hypothetical protein ABN224_03360 [Providencia rettgeri]
MREVKPTQKPVPSSDIKDLFFNSGLLDIWATSLEPKYIDRFGNCHLTAAGMEWLFKELVEKFKVDMNTAIVAAGYITIDSFQQGADLPNNELTQRNHILRDESTGEYYRWDGDLPKKVPAGSTPESTGGVGKGAWMMVTIRSWSDVHDADLYVVARHENKSATRVAALELGSSIENKNYLFSKINEKTYFSSKPLTGTIDEIVSFSDSLLVIKINGEEHKLTSFLRTPTPDDFAGANDAKKIKNGLAILSELAAVSGAPKVMKLNRTYHIGGSDYADRIEPPSDVYFLSENAKLKMLPNSAQMMIALYYRKPKNCGIIGHIELDGNRENNPAIDENDLGQNGLVVGQGTENAYFESVHAHHFTQDGHYHGANGGKDNLPPKNITYGRIIATDNGRNNSSICQYDGFHINYLYVARAGGIGGGLPKCGLDNEPDFYTDICRGGSIGTFISHDNDNNGLNIFFHNPEQEAVNIQYALIYNNKNCGVEGFFGNKLKINGGKIYSNAKAGVAIAQASDWKISCEIYNNGSAGILATITEGYKDSTAHNGPAFVEWRSNNNDFSGCVVQNNKGLGNVQLAGVVKGGITYALRNTNLYGLVCNNDRKDDAGNIYSNKAQYGLVVGQYAHNYHGKCDISVGESGKSVLINSTDSYGAVDRETFTISNLIPSQNIPANSALTITVNSSFYRSSSLLSSTFSTLPTGIIPTVSGGGEGVINIKLTNTKGTDIFINPVNYAIEVTFRYI